MKLRRQWSPEQIAGWLKRAFPEEKQNQVSHETIYRSLFIQARGVLKKELLDHLRARRTIRRSRHASLKRSGLGQIKDAVSISQRPACVEDRAIPGHWEGELVETRDLMVGNALEDIGQPCLRISVPVRMAINLEALLPAPRWFAPVGVMTEADLSVLREHKTEALAILREEQSDRIEERAAILHGVHPATNSAGPEWRGEPRPTLHPALIPDRTSWPRRTVCRITQ